MIPPVIFGFSNKTVGIGTDGMTTVAEGEVLDEIDAEIVLCMDALLVSGFCEFDDSSDCTAEAIFLNFLCR